MAILEKTRVKHGSAMDVIGSNAISDDPPAFDGVSPIWIPPDQFSLLKRDEKNALFKFNSKFKGKGKRKGKTLDANADN